MNKFKFINGIFNYSPFNLKNYLTTKTFSVKYFCNNSDANVNSVSRRERIEQILRKNFELEHLDIINESYKHSVPKNSETHFKIIIVSKAFQNKSQVVNHQSIYKLLSNEMGEKKDNKLHALSLITTTPEDWKKLEEI